jgi:HK97 family phage prohead protease
VTIASERSEIVRRSEFRASEGSDGHTLEGYAAVFNAWTDIRDAMGTYKERIAPGAFKRSIGQRTPVLQFDHGTHPLFGSLPLGGITALREDRNGLFVRAKLSDNWLVEPVRDAIRDGGVTGMSFRFRVVSDDWDDAKTERTINEVELLELGPVVWPAYNQTSVAVRSLMGVLDDETRAELARELVDALSTVEHRDDEDVHETEVTSTADASAVRTVVTSTSTVAVEPAQDDNGPDEPPVASHDNRTRIAEAIKRFRHT